MCDFKISKFNLHLHVDGKSCIYNCATGKWDWFSLTESAGLKINRWKNLGTEVRRRAIAMGALIDTKIDEWEWYKNAYQIHTNATRQAFYVVALSFKCNLKCHYCFEKNHEPSTNPIRQQTLAKLINAIKKRSLCEGTINLGIMLFGGEPLLELKKHLFLLESLKGWCEDQGIGFMSNMSTNGALITEKKIALLKPYISSVQVTFDGPKAVHDTIRITHRDKPTFDKIIRGIQLLIENKIKVTIRAQVHSGNKSHLFALVHELKEHQLLDSSYVRVTIGMLRHFSKWATCSKQWNYIEPGSETERRLMALSDTILPVQRPAVQIIPCITAGNMLCIDPLGNLYKCVTGLTDAAQRVGYLDSGGEFVFTSHYRQFYERDPMQFQDCRECAILPHCGGGCPQSALQRYGTYQHAFCGNNKALLKQRIQKMILNHGSNFNATELRH